MSATRGILGLVMVCVVIVLLSLLGIVWAFTAGLLYPHILLDGLLLVMVCLMMGGVFSLMLLMIAKQAGWLPFQHKKAPTQAAAAPATNPANPSAQKGK